MKFDTFDDHLNHIALEIYCRERRERFEEFYLFGRVAAQACDACGSSVDATHFVDCEVGAALVLELERLAAVPAQGAQPEGIEDDLYR